MNVKGKFLLRAAAGCYLVYLGISLAGNVWSDKPENYPLLLAFGVAFILFGISLAGLSARAYMKNERSSETSHPACAEWDASHAVRNKRMEKDAVYGEDSETEQDDAGVDKRDKP